METENGVSYSVSGTEEGSARHAGQGRGRDWEPFELQPSIIDAVSKLCPENEADEIWRVVGHSLIEQAKDLLEEARFLLEIWRQLREDEADQATSRDVPAALPEPPMVRERLIQEICFLAEHLRAAAVKPTSPAPSSLQGDRSREILDYALTTSDHHGPGSGCGSGCGRPQSAVSSRDGRDTPLRRSRTNTPSSQDGSQSSVLSGRSDPLPVEQVSLANIDTAVEHLREAVEEEIAQRKEDIVFLQECTEEERAHVEETYSAPSLRELRELGTRLEREVLRGASRDDSSPGTGTGSLVSSGNRGQPRPPSGKCPEHQLRRASRVKPKLPSIPRKASRLSEHDTCISAVQMSGKPIT